MGHAVYPYQRSLRRTLVLLNKKQQTKHFLKQFLYRIYKPLERTATHVLLLIRVGIDSIGMKLGFVNKYPLSQQIEIDNAAIEKLLTDRSIEIFEQDKLLQQVILACWFTQKQDPQTTRSNDAVTSFTYIEKWYRSVQQQNLHAVIFYDALPAGFTEQYSTEKIQFRKYTAGNYSIYEERWMAVYMFLQQTTIQSLFITDIGDVEVRKDPFTLPFAGDILYVGRDDSSRLWHSRWMLREIKQYSGDTGFRFPYNFIYMPMYNAGIIGGNLKTVMHVLAAIIQLTGKSGTSAHKDMSLLNYIIYSERRPALKASLTEPRKVEPIHDTASNALLQTGYPLQSAFRKYEQRTDVFFAHK